MSGKEAARRGSHRRPGLIVERLEARGLLSVVPIFMARAHPASHAHATAQASAGNLGAAASAQPTPHELARQRYNAKASGTFLTGPGRYTDQKLQVFVSTTGGSNQSFHLTLQIRYFVPIDPSKPVTGVASLIPRNTSTTGSNLYLDLTAPQNPGSNALPGHFTWTVDPTSGGLYSAAGGFGTGQGTLDIHYMPGGTRTSRGFSAGRAYVVINGLINADSIFSDIGGPGNTPGHP